MSAIIFAYSIVAVLSLICSIVCYMGYRKRVLLYLMLGMLTCFFVGIITLVFYVIVKSIAVDIMVIEWYLIKVLAVFSLLLFVLDYIFLRLINN